MDQTKSCVAIIATLAVMACLTQLITLLTDSVIELTALIFQHNLTLPTNNRDLKFLCTFALLIIRSLFHPHKLHHNLTIGQEATKSTFLRHQLQRILTIAQEAIKSMCRRHLLQFIIDQ